MYSLEELHSIAMEMPNIENRVPISDKIEMEEDLEKMDGYYFSERGLKQLCRFIDVPYQYINRCPPSLKLANINTWLNKNKRDYVLRTYEGMIESVVTPRYTDIPHSVITRKLLEYDWKGDPPVAQEIVANAFDFSCYLYWPMSQVQDDSLVKAIRIYNNRTAEAALSAKAGVYRLICSNGLVLPFKESVSRKVHKGGEDFVLDFNWRFDILSKWDSWFPMALDHKKGLPLSPLVPVELRRAANREWEEDRYVKRSKVINLLTSSAKGYPIVTRNQIEEEAGKLLLMN